MKSKFYTFLSAVIFISGSLFAQKNTTVDPTNCRDGESVEYCTTHKKMAEYWAAHPEEHALFLAAQEMQKGKDTPVEKGTVYTIPVVFHILHNGGIENISDEQVQDAVAIMNRDYRLLNADASGVHADFQGLPADVEIEFVLATKDPAGNCFTGITRTQNALTSDGSSGQAQVAAIVDYNDVYNGVWPHNKYLNIYVCAEIGGAAGYTFNPWTSSAATESNMYYNGIFVLHNYTGSIGTSSTYTSRTLTHEVGHWLNLEHTWGPNNNPGNAASCTDDDGVTDTPNTIGVTSCALNEATCGPRANVENYMDYSYCSKMFTPGQVTRMRNALNSATAGRSNIKTATNLTNVGGDGNLYLCDADFSASNTIVCVGSSVTFTDESYNSVNGWNWTFEGGTPALSTDQNPVITYDTPGIYQVTLDATDGTVSDIESKTAYIQVLPPPANIPFLEGFEAYTTLTGLTEWAVLDYGNNAKFAMDLSQGHASSKCVKLANYGQPAGNKDELISSSVDLSGVNPTTEIVTLSFRYAYKKRTTADDEWLKVFLTTDCGENWQQKKTLHGSALNTLTSTTAWTPSSDADWKTVHMTNVTSAYFLENFRYKFVFESDYGNNFYLDNINIYKGSPSNELVTSSAGLDEMSSVTKDMIVYPNPSDGDLNVEFGLQEASIVDLVVTELTGKIVNAVRIQGAAGTNLVMLDNGSLEAGTYFVTMKAANGSRIVKQIIVK